MPSDWKTTLNLPSTSFAMRGMMAKMEPKYLADPDFIRAKPCDVEQPDYVLLHGPAFANGSIHMGHALNVIIKDMWCRAKQLDGFRVDWQLGFDCHGLPIEINVDKDKKLSGHTKYNACTKYAEKFIALQTKQLQRLGLCINFEPYRTMSEQYRLSTVRSFIDLYKRGHIVRKTYPIHICPLCASPLANAEVEHQTKHTESFYVKFPIVSKSDGLVDHQAFAKDTYMVAWTTSPWTLWANKALVIDDNLGYAIYRHQGQNLIMKSNYRSDDYRSDDYRSDDYRSDDCHILPMVMQDEVALSLSAHFYAISPLTGQKVPIISEPIVGEEGTGIIHIAPDHGLEDYTIGQKHDLGSSDIRIDLKGRYSSGPLQGESIFTCNDSIALLLKDYLLHRHIITHSYPHCWRHKTPVFVSALPQWFVDLSSPGIKDTIISHVDTLVCEEWEKNNLKKMILSRADWCISRRRQWGCPVPLPISVDGSIPTDVDNIVNDLDIHLTTGELDMDSLYADLYSNDHVSAYKLRDVLDVWFESGLYASIYSKPGYKHVVEGIDQFRGWFQSCIILGALLKKKPVIQQLTSHGFVMDQDNNKMSKSLDNVVDPLHVVNKYGADVLRLWVAKSDFKQSSNYSHEIMEAISNDYRKIRNVSRFLLGTIGDDYRASSLISMSSLIDRWIVFKAQRLVRNSIKYYDKLQVHLLLHEVLNFCTKYLSNFYINVSRKRIYTEHPSSTNYKSAVSACYHCLLSLATVLKPIIPFTIFDIGRIHDIPDTWYILRDLGWSETEDDEMCLILDLYEIVTNKAHKYVAPCCTIYTPHAARLMSLNINLADTLLVADVKVIDSDVLVVEVVEGEHYTKCPRCWNYVKHLEDDICSTCVCQTKGRL